MKFCIIVTVVCVSMHMGLLQAAVIPGGGADEEHRGVSFVRRRRASDVLESDDANPAVPAAFAPELSLVDAADDSPVAARAYGGGRLRSGSNSSSRRRGGVKAASKRRRNRRNEGCANENEDEARDESTEEPTDDGSHDEDETIAVPKEEEDNHSEDSD